MLGAKPRINTRVADNTGNSTIHSGSLSATGGLDGPSFNVFFRLEKV